MATEHVERTDYSQRELLYNAFMAPALRQALFALALPPHSRGLDLGCGPGGLFGLIDAAAQAARVTGLDVARGHLETAQRQIDRHALTSRFDVVQADLCDPLPFPAGAFDWAWTADTLNSATEEGPFPDPVDVLREVRRVVKPGGVIACFLTNRLGAIYLPGYAAIEHHLATAVSVRYKNRIACIPRSATRIRWPGSRRQG